MPADTFVASQRESALFRRVDVTSPIVNSCRAGDDIDDSEGCVSLCMLMGIVENFEAA